jgi:lipopolysaccharide export system protein LptA
MNSRPHNHSDLSQSDADLLGRLTDFAETIEPDPTFKVDLEAELLQTYSSKSPQTANKGTHSMNFVLPRLNRRAALVACASLAIAAAFVIPPLTSGRTTGWLAALFHSVVDPNANAQTLAQAMAAGAVTITADNQEYDEATQQLSAIGDAVFAFPGAQIEAKADQIKYVPTSRQLTLSGNVEISQRGEILRGAQASCSFVEKQCSLTQK